MTTLLEVLAIFAAVTMSLTALIALASYERARAFRRIQGDEVSCARRARRLRISMPERGRSSKRGATVGPANANANPKNRNVHCA